MKIKKPMRPMEEIPKKFKRLKKPPNTYLLLLRRTDESSSEVKKYTFW
jgi:hypothetical protein